MSSLNLIKDALYYLHPDNANSEATIKMARGQLNGVIATVMAIKGYSFEKAVAFVAPHLPEKIVRDVIPEPWWNEFAKNGLYTHGLDNPDIVRKEQANDRR